MLKESSRRHSSQSLSELTAAPPLSNPQSTSLRKRRRSSESELNIGHKRTHRVTREDRAALAQARPLEGHASEQTDVQSPSSNSKAQPIGTQTGQKRKRCASVEVPDPSPSSNYSIPDSQTSILSCPSLPLTEANLRLLSGASMATPITPSKTSSTFSIKDTTVAGIRRVLCDNKMFIDDDAAYKRYPEVEAMVNSLVRADRGPGSEMQPVSLNKIQEARQEFAMANELTFLVEVWKLLVHDNRNVMTISVPDKVEWIKQAWNKDDLRLNWQADFVRTAIPTLTALNMVSAKLLESLPRVKVPKPDLTYGLRINAFDEREQMINDTFGQYSMLSRDLSHAFFIVEAKSSAGTVEDAENQCCRGGAALVHARMRFNSEAVGDNLAVGEDLPVGADLASIAFSLAIVPAKAHMFVHWAEVRAGTSPAGLAKGGDNQIPRETGSDGVRNVVYHMNLVESYDFRGRDGNAFPLLRKEVENVLDWGTLKRKYEVKEVLARIAKRLEEVDTPQPTKKKRALN